MRSGTCENHDSAVVVMFDALGYAGGSLPCPLCEAEGKIEKLEQRVEELESEADS